MRLLRWLILPVLLVPLTRVLFTGFGRDPSHIPSPLIGQPMPSFALTTLDGQPLDSASLRGKPVLLNFWASWCGPCVEEFPLLKRALAEHADDRLAVVGIVYQDNSESARAFLARHGDGGWPSLTDADSRTALNFGVTGPPETYFVDANGVVRAKQIGPLDTRTLNAKLAEIGLTS
jgi:cytochrome c biogenesis protein CcmG/thiol:disulfide interchange protein DsbE